MVSVSVTPHRLSVAMFLAVLIVAAVLRFHVLPELPVGFHYDEAANGILAGEIASGDKAPIFIPSYTGKEVLFFYWAALWMKLLGVTPLALRLAAASVGLLTVAATVWLTCELLFDHPDARWIALIAGGFLATSFWHLVLSRCGFRAITQPLFQALTVATLWRGLRADGPGRFARATVMWLVLAGLFCGLTAYTYLAARAFPLPLALALVALLVVDRRGIPTRLLQIIVFASTAALVLAPLSHYWLVHPGSFVARARQVGANSAADAWEGVVACLRMFFLRGDPYIRFNVPHRPIFGQLVAALFVLGLAIGANQVLLVVRSPRPRPSALSIASQVLILAATLVMVLPSALATGDITPSNLRAVGLLPFVYALPAMGLGALAGVLRRFVRPNSWLARWSLPACAFLLLPLSLLSVVPTYRKWATSPALYYAADGDLADIAAYLNRADLTRATPYVASRHYRHPTLAFLAEDYEDVRWLTGGRSLVFPAEGEALFLFPRSASQDLEWVRSTLPDDALVAAPPGPDGAAAFHVFRAGMADAVGPPISFAANLGGVVGLLGYEVVGEPHSGESVDMAVWWRVLAAPDQLDYRPVLRLTDEWGLVWGETQPFHYPSEQWRLGDVIVDYHSVPVAPGAPPGAYDVRFGLYSPAADVRLPVLDETGAYAGTDVEFPVRVLRAVGPSPDEDWAIRKRLDADVDGLTLLGANLDTSTARPGEPLHLTLFWRANWAAVPSYDVALRLQDTDIYRGAPVHGSYPFSEWAAGQVVADRYDSRLSLDIPPGRYPLRVEVAGVALDVGYVTVVEVERGFEVPPISYPLDVTLGGCVQLVGYDLSSDTISRGGTVTVTLIWRAVTEMDTDYTVFTHLLAPDGSMTGQRDGQPVGGTYPTSLWLPGEVVTDVREILVRPDAAPGEHLLEVGMYVAETGARLPVEAQQSDAIILRTLTVVD